MRLRQKPCTNEGCKSVIVLSFTDVPEGPMNDWSWVILNFGTLCPSLFMDHCFWQPNGATDTLSMCLITGIGNMRANPLSTSSCIILFKSSLWVTADLWFPRSMWNFMSNLRISSGISFSGNEAPLDRISFTCFQSGWFEFFFLVTQVFWILNHRTLVSSFELVWQYLDWNQIILTQLRYVVQLLSCIGIQIVVCDLLLNLCRRLNCIFRL